MAVRTIAHISDLHLDGSPKSFAAAVAIRDALSANNADHIVLTGDVTDRGRHAEFEQFKTTFSSFMEAGRLTIVPGNHDRLGDGIARHLMQGTRVDCVRTDGLHLVRVDSTGPHNQNVVLGHGKIDESTIAETESAIRQAGPSDLVVVALHHHLLPLPEDLFIEKLATWFKLPIAKELRLGNELLNRLRGTCDLILHGHRHVPMEALFTDTARTLGLYNAGSTTELNRFRIFTHDAGRLIGQPEWVETMT